MMKRNFNINELQQIALLASVLRECNGVKPFSLANRIHACMKAAQFALKDAQDQVDLINERTRTTPEMDKSTIAELEAQRQQEGSELLNKAIEIDIPEIREAEFEQLEIDGERTMPQLDNKGKQIGSYQLSNRQAYFGLVGLIII